MLAAWLYPAFLATSFAYACVGMGGGSAYLALFALTSVNSDAMRVAALVMNLVVAGGGFLHFRKAGHFRAELLVPFVVTSLPAAFVGAMVRLPATTFRILLAFVLLLVAARMLLWSKSMPEARSVSWSKAWRYGPIVGLAAGLLAGLVGVGGGIFLAPVLILMGWANGKHAAAAASAFVLLNSTVGLVAHFGRSNFPEAWTWPLLLVVLIGGQVGARLGAFRLSPTVLQRVFGCAILAVVVNLTWRALS